MTSRRKSAVAFNDPRVSLAAGLAATVVGSLLLFDAYERRGNSRPWVLKLIPSA